MIHVILSPDSIGAKNLIEILHFVQDDTIEYMENNHRQDGKFILGFFIGGLLGALIIFFLGTKEGKRAGRLIQKKGEEALDTLEEKGQELIEKGEEMRDQIAENIQNTTESLQDEAINRIDTGLEKLEDVQKSGLRTTTTFHKHFINLPKKK